MRKTLFLINYTDSLYFIGNNAFNEVRLLFAIIE